MKVRCSIVLLLAGVCAAESGEGGLPGRQSEMREFNAQVDQSERELSALSALPDADFDPQAELPTAKAGETAVVADSGMYFDNEKSCLIYIGNVRLNNARVHLRAAHRLYVLMPEKEKKGAAHQAVTSGSSATIRVNPEDNPTDEARTAEDSQIAVKVNAHNAAVDVPGNRVLLEGHRAAPSLTMVRQYDSLILQAQQNGEPAWAFADSSGNVLLLGTQIVGVFMQRTEYRRLVAQHGPVFYEAATRTLTVYGPSTLTTTQGTLSSSRQLRLVFAPGEPVVNPDKGPFSQFANMRLGRVERAEAQGDVLCTMPAQQGRLDARATGDTFNYDATTGACRIAGGLCSVNYGGQSLTTDGEVNLLPNGDATITGDAVSGTYERPAPGSRPDAAPIAGTYATRGPIQYIAEENSVTFPAGLATKDAVAEFRCSGTAKFYLQRADTPMPPRKPGSPNITVAHQQGVSYMTAEGAVFMHAEPDGNQKAVDLDCDSMQADLLHGTAHLVGSDGRVAHLRYGDYTLWAQSPKNSKAELQVMENGDLHAIGDRVKAALPGEKGTTTIDCSEELRLQRAEHMLIIGPNSTLRSPDGIMTAKAHTRAELVEAPSTRPRLPKYPHLNYNYTGLRSAITQRGGSLRTAKLSMQCEGLMQMSMLPGKPGDNPRDLLQKAVAWGRVRLAGKDAKGKLMRADGEQLDFDHATGNIYLRGSQVSLMDANNIHTASGPGACITIDPKNNVHIYGQRQTTTANRIHQQIDLQEKQ